MQKNIEKKTFYIDSNDLKIYYDVYKNKDISTFKGLVQIAHGMIEHKGNYAYIANKIASAGYIVAINDHRGHGESINNEIFLGEMGKNGFEVAFRDFRNLNLHLKNIYKPKKNIIIGHSMGSLFARRYLQEDEKEIDILILCGSPSPYFGIEFGVLMLKLFKNINFMHKLLIFTFNAKFNKDDDLFCGKISGILWINRDKDVLKSHINDKKQNHSFSANSFINLFYGVKKVFSKYPNKIQKTNLPILFISGEDDACGKFGKGVFRAYKHIIKQGYENVKLVLYSKARHELFLELNKDEVIYDVLCFIQDH